MIKQRIQEIRDLAGLPRLSEAKTSQPAGIEEDAGETARQWYHEAPKVVKSGGLKYTLKPKATVKSGETVYFKYWAPKPKGEVVAPIIQFVVTYNRGSDLYDIEIESYDINMNKIANRRVNGLGWENFANFGFLRDVMQESRDPADSRLQDEIKEFAGTRRVPDEPDQYDSISDAIADMQVQVFGGRRGIAPPKPKQEEKDERIFHMFAFYQGPDLRKRGSVAVPDTKDAKKKARLAGERLYGYDPGNDHLARGGWEMHDEGTGKAFWVRTIVKHFLDPENRKESKDSMDADTHEAVWGLGAKAARSGSTDLDGAFLAAVKKHGTKVFPAGRVRESDSWFEEYFQAFKDGFNSSKRGG